MRWVVPGQGGQGVRQQESPLSIGKVWANEFSSADHRLPSFLRGLELFLSQRGTLLRLRLGYGGLFLRNNLIVYLWDI